MLGIRKARDSDIHFIFLCLKDKDEDFATQCGYGKRYFTHPLTPEKIRNFQNARKETSMFFIIVNNQTSIGSFELAIYEDKKECSIERFLIADEHRFQGYGTKVLSMVSDYVFNNLNFDRVRLKVYDFNKSAIKCYVKAGFKECSKETRDNGWIAIGMEKLNERRA